MCLSICVNIELRYQKADTDDEGQPAGSKTKTITNQSTSHELLISENLSRPLNVSSNSANVSMQTNVRVRIINFWKYVCLFAKCTQAHSGVTHLFI